ncbi:class I glutamine amidotransferase-like protein [Rhizoclosmatium globosum]|uniref:Class I glutamine amidotransferase-like protein n=1 Tax=Rhizoclosmatium globosum TaxID=329046 RepID=A0A1Y2CIJ7_9FUNG|nr:class I glutamine amidotransferase-like protein [Rhizoclosmatium globosum]|eukprot:ORY46842.1 class I glutamine amidotransferase-like protein [Rhizoclosmatium globosum]
MTFKSIRKIAILVFPGVDDIDFVGPYRVLQAAIAAQEKLGGKQSLESCKLLTFAPYSPNSLLTSAHGIQFKPDGVFDESQYLPMISSLSPVEGAYTEFKNGNLIKLLKEVSAANPQLLWGSVCTGAMLLGHAGILKAGNQGSTHHSAKNELEALGVLVKEDRVVFDGGIATSGGVTSGIDLALNLVAQIIDSAAAENVATGMEYEYFKAN